MSDPLPHNNPQNKTENINININYMNATKLDHPHFNSTNPTSAHPLRHSPKLPSFIALRANGWSLASISLQIDVPKSTLWDWETKHRDQILRLQQFQLEKFQERFLPTYEDELARLSLYLRNVQTALENCRFDDLSPAFLLQMDLYLRTRLTRLHQQPPRSEAQASPGRITSHPFDTFNPQHPP